MAFGASSNLPPLVNMRGRLVSSADEKASLFSVHYDAKHCRDSFQEPYSCHPCPVLCSVAFSSSFVRSLFLDLDPNGRNDLVTMFPLFYEWVARERVNKLTVIFRYLVRGGSFPAC